MQLPSGAFFEPGPFEGVLGPTLAKKLTKTSKKQNKNNHVLQRLNCPPTDAQGWSYPAHRRPGMVIPRPWAHRRPGMVIPRSFKPQFRINIILAVLKTIFNFLLGPGGSGGGSGLPCPSGNRRFLADSGRNPGIFNFYFGLKRS